MFVQFYLANMSPVNLEWYIGCYTDAKESAMDKKNPGGETGAGKGTNTIQFCRQICANFNYTYLGTQVSLRVCLFFTH